MLLHPVGKLCFLDNPSHSFGAGPSLCGQRGSTVAETEFPDRTYRDYSPKR